jgi:hypothetical protein
MGQASEKGRKAFGGRRQKFKIGSDRDECEGSSGNRDPPQSQAHWGRRMAVKVAYLSHKLFLSPFMYFQCFPNLSSDALAHACTKIPHLDVYVFSGDESFLPTGSGTRTARV